MDEVIKRLEHLQAAFDASAETLHLSVLETELAALNQAMQSPDFWSDQSAAQTTAKQQAALDTRLQPWFVLRTRLHDALELARLNDTSVKADLERDTAALEGDLENLKKELRYSGPYDQSAAILSIHAGAGGTDAQDWTQMLLRMYIRWAEKGGYKVTTLEQSGGEEAGLKSVTFEVDGPLAYGKLKGEHGVHRLVRLSPFNADNLRQTSFAKVEVMPKIDSPEVVELDEKDLKIDVYRSGGHGGQSVNTTDSAVRITHLPTGLTVAIQNERSQLQNRETALTILRSRLAQLQLEQHTERLADLKGPSEQAAWGNQIRSYVLHPYTMVKDLRSRHETSDAAAVLDGDLDPFLEAFVPED